jgi:DnaJ family protein C protein 14
MIITTHCGAFNYSVLTSLSLPTILKFCFSITNAGCFVSLNHARFLVLIGTAYAMYSVQVTVGWLGVFLAINLAFLSNDILNFLLQWFDNVSESSHSEEQKQSETVVEDDFSEECEYPIPPVESENLHSCKSSSKPPAVTTSVVDKQKELLVNKVVKEETNSIDEMKRILKSLNHYEALGFIRHKKIDAAILKKEYRKKVFVFEIFRFVSLRSIYLFRLFHISLNIISTALQCCRIKF